MSTPSVRSDPDGHPSEQTIAEEIRFLAHRARDRDRPLVVIAYCRNENDSRALEMALRAELEAIDMGLGPIDPARGDTADIFDDIAAHSGAGRLAVVGGLPRDPKHPSRPAPGLLHYLNLHRDRIARERLRFLLVLRTADAPALIATAPDFWDFRQATYWIERDASVSLPHARDVMPAGTSARPEPIRVAAGEVAAKTGQVRELAAETEDSSARAALLLDLAAWLEPRGQSREALDAAQEALSLLGSEDDALRGPILLQLGGLQVALGNGAEARALFERSLDIGERLAEQEPGRADYQRDVSVFLNKLGDLHVALGNGAEARALFERAVAMRRAVLAAAPEQVIVTRELAVALSLRGSPSDRAEAQQLLRALASRDALESRFRPLLERLDGSGSDPEAPVGG